MLGERGANGGSRMPPRLLPAMALGVGGDCVCCMFTEAQGLALSGHSVLPDQRLLHT